MTCVKGETSWFRKHSASWLYFWNSLHTRAAALLGLSCEQLVCDTVKNRLHKIVTINIKTGISLAFLYTNKFPVTLGFSPAALLDCEVGQRRVISTLVFSGLTSLYRNQNCVSSTICQLLLLYVEKAMVCKKLGWLHGKRVTLSAVATALAIHVHAILYNHTRQYRLAFPTVVGFTLSPCAPPFYSTPQPLTPTQKIAEITFLGFNLPVESQPATSQLLWPLFSMALLH